ncbi:hypothetical protein LSAT2_031549 [Lamellibrachia satsuma]|nr:hypothetical protein LSAT2_031549 [Lamellibrachia satsuma]
MNVKTSSFRIDFFGTGAKFLALLLRVVSLEKALSHVITLQQSETTFEESSILSPYSSCGDGNKCSIKHLYHQNI